MTTTKVWIVEHPPRWQGDDDTEEVQAGGWYVGTNGDLVFANNMTSDYPLHVQGFAAGTWSKVRRYF